MLWKRKFTAINEIQYLEANLEQWCDNDETPRCLYMYEKPKSNLQFYIPCVQEESKVYLLKPRIRQII